MRKFLNDHQVENANKIVDIFEEQSINLKIFLKQYPEYGKLTLKEKQELITKSLKKHEKLITKTGFNTYIGQGKIMFAEDQWQKALNAYGFAIQGCQDSYRNSFTAATAVADIALLASLADPTGIAYAAAAVSYFVTIYFLDNERDNCMDLAANLFCNEVGI